jgi:hypothetical protein
MEAAMDLNKIERFQDFEEYVRGFYNESKPSNGNKYPRFLSWEHCYLQFQKVLKDVYRNKIPTNEEKRNLALWLAWYLASWGMYRGSTALLNTNYQVHIPVVDILLKSDWKLLNNLKCADFVKNNIWEKMNVLDGAISECYKKVFPHKGEKERTPTKTLVTKILLGTLGCSPAFDDFFQNSISYNSSFIFLKKEGKGVRSFNKKTMEGLCSFYERNAGFKKLEKALILMNSDISYPQMKILDMGFWYFWLKNGINIKKARKEAKNDFD